LRPTTYHKLAASIALTLLFALTFSILVAACGSDTPTAAEAQLPDVINLSANQTLSVRSIEEITANEPPRITDITDSEATLLFDSSVPLVCAIVYGQTSAYGKIATDQDMAGGAHTDHHPFMAGLEPDTEYHYRVQGSAADGTFYVGTDATFSTPPAQEEEEVNLAALAAGAQVTAVSSNFGGAANDQTWGANSAIDGSTGTAWSSNGDGDDAFIVIKLAQTARLHAIEVWTRTMSNNTAQIFSFTLTTDDGEVLGPFTLDDALQSYRFEVDVVTRSLRLDAVTSNSGNTGLIEFAAYGTPL
jgi:hypothetical protein